MHGLSAAVNRYSYLKRMAPRCPKLDILAKLISKTSVIIYEYIKINLNGIYRSINA